MELIAPLSSGILGATSGTVRIYRRATSTRATLYSDFEGADSLANTSDLSLDAYGRLEVYVNENVDVTVYSSTGTQVATFTVGSAAPAIEYQGQGFSGVDYETANTGIGSGYPTTVQAILDLWKTNSGAADWKVLYGGTATTLQSAFKLGIFFNVKDTVYGALGDGSTDDTAAIAAAIVAAEVAGGIVYLPAGTYRHTSALTLTAKVSLLGAGANATVLSIDHATANNVVISGNTSYGQRFISGIRFTALQANTGLLLSRSGIEWCHVSRCYFGGTYSNGSSLVDLAAGDVNARFAIEDCRFDVASSTGSAIICTGAAAGSSGVSISRCAFVTPATCNSTLGIVAGKGLTMDSCTFDNSAATAGTFTCFKDGAGVSTALDARITNCDFGNGGGATVTAITLGTFGATSVFFEGNNDFGTTVTAYSYVAAFASLGAQVVLKTRETRRKVYTTSVSIAIATDQYGIIRVSTDAAVTLTPTQVPEGAGGFVLCTVTGGTNRIVTFASPFLASGWLSSIHTSTPTMVDGFTTPVSYFCNGQSGQLAMSIQVGGT